MIGSGTLSHGCLRSQGLLTPGLDNTRLYMSLTAGAGTRCMSLLSSSPSLWDLVDEEERAIHRPDG